jgi:hypothetical protein
MWIAKGTLLALWLLGFGTMAWLYFALYRHLRPNSAVGLSVITGVTTHNPFWWAAFVVCLVLGYTTVRSWVGAAGIVDHVIRDRIDSGRLSRIVSYPCV